MQISVDPSTFQTSMDDLLFDTISREDKIKDRWEAFTGRDIDILLQEICLHKSTKHRVGGGESTSRPENLSGAKHRKKDKEVKEEKNISESSGASVKI